jgi:hypothetical protein
MIEIQLFIIQFSKKIKVRENLTGGKALFGYSVLPV